ncbi:MAG: TIGR01777 family protein [Deltaproteobacteria bacterium]|nr:TIGR01777 family protein [Deltaproteobacteria bacterium]
MKILLTGGTGFIGRPLLKKLLEKGHEVTLLTRQQIPNFACPDGTDAIINLAGETIAERWTKEKKEKIRRSRVDTTRAIITAIGKTSQKPRLLINASAVGYYGDTKEVPVDESSPRGYDFLAEVCREWEETAQEAEKDNVRVVRLRCGVVLGKDGGALQKMLPPFKFFVGGPIGSGNQWFPWIHREDVIHAIFFALENEKLSGAVNVTSPEPIRQKEFAKILGKVLGRPSSLPVPSFVLKLLLGEMSEMLLTGQRVVPKKLTEAGFQFQYPDLESALKAIFY